MHSSTQTPNQFTFDDQWIQYADDQIVVANKPSGLLSVPGRGPEKHECLLSHLQTIYPDIKIIHRLDMDTSGLMVLALNAEAHRHLSRQFQERETAKTYLAVCAGIPSESAGKINLPMRCDWERRPRQMIDFKQGKHAETLWKILAQHKDRFLVELTPITGRSHQLRLHMKSLGHPILGDNLYADAHSLTMSARLLLHATRLSFKHPVSEKTLSFHLEPDFESIT